MAGYGPWAGAAGGISAAEQDIAQQAMAPDVQRFTKSKADLAEIKVGEQRRFAAEMQRMPSGAEQNPAWAMAGAAFRAGLPEAYKYANAASLMDYRRQTGETAQLHGIESRNRIGLQNLDLKARVLTGVTNDESLQYALQDYEAQTGDRTELLDRNGKLTVPYSPELVGRLRAQAISAKDQLLFDWRDRMESRRVKEDASKQTNREFWQNMENQQEREAAKARGRLGVNGATGLFPSSAQITIGADYLANKFGVDSKEPWSRVMGRELIDEAKRLRALNPALDASEALGEAFKGLDKKGIFQAHRLLDKAADKYRPMALPASGKLEDLIPGQLYTDGKDIREWTGKGWSTPTRPITRGEIEISHEDAVRALGGSLDEEGEPGSTGEEEDGEE